MFYFDLPEFWRGTQFGPVLIYAVDAGGAPLNLAGYQVSAKTDYFDLLPVITDPPNGEITIELTAAQTQDIELGQYRWDLLVTDPLGAVTGPFIGGVVRVNQPESNA